MSKMWERTWAGIASVRIDVEWVGKVETLGEKRGLVGIGEQRNGESG